jgi:copper oxidase (laccase) domain-containing protein
MGPCIHACCFEVGVEVAEQFPSPFSVQNRDKFNLDLTAALKAQLCESGVPDSQISITDECTCCHPERYYSYRREGKKAGRMIAVFGWKQLSN